jgi:hypothetical protein
VLCVETIGRIRRRRLVQGESISAIARDLVLSRNTVKRALRFEGEGFEYRRTIQPRPKLGPYVEMVEAWIEAEEKLPRREWRTAQRIYEALCVEGYGGTVDTVRRQMRAFERRRHPESRAFIPQYLAGGEAYQFDFSHEHVELGGVDQVVKLAHVRLSHSRGFFLVAYPRESQEMVFDAHARAFTFFDGVPRRGMADFVAGNKIVDQDGGHTTVILERAHMAAEPVRQRIAARRLGIGIAARAHRGDEQMRIKRHHVAVTVYRQSAPGIIDEQLFTGEVPLAHRAVQPLFSSPVNLAERAALVCRGAVLADVFFPQELQRHVPMALQFAVDPRTVRRRPDRGLYRCRGAEDPLHKLGFGQHFGFHRTDPAGAQGVDILRDRPKGQPERPCTTRRAAHV